ncbi:urease subunit gamma [Alkalihalophilus pseudofirmus]|nr:urease subunit gamma [Alkalihalophilus pseudofirmus]
MHLTPRENERLTLFVAAEFARRKFRDGVKLNHPETIAIICDELLEQARYGNKSLSDVIALGRRILTKEDVMMGVDKLIPILQVEGMFDDGAKLITVYDPITCSTRSELEGESYITFK